MTRWIHPDACQYCGLEYVKESISDRALHRSFHSRIERVVDPKPIKRFLAEIKTDPDAELVTKYSPSWKHLQMYERARMFQREMEYDFIQWADGIDRDDQPHGFLMSGTTKKGEDCIVGACAFRMISDCWTLMWVWIRPGSRHSGVLSCRWSDYLRRFGDFKIDAPLSNAMKKFVLKHGSPVQKAYFGDCLLIVDKEDKWL